MKIKYQASFFANLDEFKATTENTLLLLSSFAKIGVNLLPGTFNEIGAPGLLSGLRMRFSSESGDTMVMIPSGRIDIIRTKDFSIETELESLESFFEFAERCIFAILDGRKGLLGNRLALVVQDMGKDASSELLKGFFSALFKPPAPFDVASPSEWTFRANAPRDMAFGSYVSSVNVILKIERVQGVLVQREGVANDFDRIMTEFDINTVADDKSTRFTPADFRSFLNGAATILTELESGLTERLSV